MYGILGRAPLNPPLLLRRLGTAPTWKYKHHLYDISISLSLGSQGDACTAHRGME